MKNIIPTIVIALLLFVALPSCKEQDHVLPTITMEGKNTFGCLVNGELWLPKGRGDGSLPIFVDMTGDGFISISASNKNNTGIGIIFIDSSGFKINQLYNYENEGTSYGRYNFRSGNGVCFYDNTHMISGKMMLSKLENQVISGTFEFTTYNPDCGDTIRVTEGRFDIGTITR